jgi:hypothetical protein
VDIDALIESRAKQNGHAEQEREALWAESVSRYYAERRQYLRAAWIEYHAGQAARHRRERDALVSYHEQKAEQLMTDEPKGAA